MLKKILRLLRTLQARACLRVASFPGGRLRVGMCGAAQATLVTSCLFGVVGGAWAICVLVNACTLQPWQDLASDEEVCWNHTKTNLPELRGLNLEQIFPHLCQHGLLTYSEKEKLKNDYFKTHEKIDELLKWIPMKGSDALARFVKCLRNSTDGTGHDELATSLGDKIRQ